MGPSRKPWFPPAAWVVHALLGITLFVVSMATLASWDAASPYPLLYVCVATCAFCFLSRVESAIYAAVIVAVYATALILLPGYGTEEAAAHLGLLAVSLGVGATLLGGLRAKHNALLERIGELSRTDAATGLLDRRGIDEALAIEVERAGRSGIRFGVIAVSVDALDPLTADPAGEHRATLAGRAIARSIRSVDFAGRLQSNLFCVLSIYTDERGGETLVERIRAAAALGAPACPLPLSFGIAIYGRHGTSPAALLEAAESALVAARDLGGERSIIAPSRASTDAELHDPSVRVAARA